MSLTPLLDIGRLPSATNEWQSAKSSFWGDTFVIRNAHAASTSFCRRHSVVTAVVRRRKEPSLDNVIERQKKLNVVNKLKNLLVKQPGKVMSLRKLGKNRSEVGLHDKRKLQTYIKRFPGVFRIYEERCGTKYFRLTSVAEAQYYEELELKKEMEDILLIKVRKLLMMSVDKRILLDRLLHFKYDLGLPDDFKTHMAYNHPEFFKVVRTPLGPALELTYWDPEIAVTYAEKNKKQVDFEEITVSGRPPKFPVMNLPSGHQLKKKDRAVLANFLKTPLVSPYESCNPPLDPASKMAERRLVAIVEEILNLMLEKKTLVDHLTHFRSDYRFSQQLHGMLIRHPEVFYVSFKGNRDTVFLKDAYEKSELKEKDPMVLVKERLAALVELNESAVRMADLDSGDEGEVSDDLDDVDAADDDGHSRHRYGYLSDDDDDMSDTKAYILAQRRKRELAVALRPPVEPW